MAESKRKCACCGEIKTFSKNHLSEYGHICLECMDDVKNTLEDLRRAATDSKDESDFLTN